MTTNYLCECTSARKRGALGIFYAIAEEIKATDADAAEAAYREKYETCGPPVLVKPAPCQLQRDLQAALGLSDSDFGHHASDLYVLDKPGVREWLKANYEWYSNVSSFVGAEGSDWAGKLALDIPFACHKASK